MTSSNPTCLVEWLRLLVTGVAEQYSHISILSETSTEKFYSATLLARLRLDDDRTGLRKFVVTGIDTGGKVLEPGQIPATLELLGAELGVISKCLLCNAKKTDAIGKQLNSLDVLYVEIKGDSYSTPDSRVCVQFGHVLFGNLRVRESTEALKQLPTQSDKSIKGEDALITLRQVFRATLLLCLSEELVWSPTTADRQEIARGGSGDRSELSFHYAVKRYPRFEGWLDYYFPNGATLITRQRQALNLYAALLAIKVRGKSKKTAILLQDLIRELIDYFNSWLSGTTATVAGKRMRNLIDELRDLPEPALFGENLADAAPLDQLDLLSLIQASKLRGTAPAVLRLLEYASARVQAACIHTLISLDAVPEITVIARYAESPRTEVAHAAARALAAIATEDSAKHLVELMETEKLGVNEETVMSLARTHTVTALAWIFNFCARYRGNLPPIALEECIDHLLPEVEAGRVVFAADKDWIQKVAMEMYDREDFQILCRRVALKAVRLFHLESAVDLFHKALSDKSFRTRISAMKCAAAFPSDENAQAILRSANEPNDDDALTEWIMAGLEVNSGLDGRSGYVASKEDLNLASAALDALKEMGISYYERYGPQVPDSAGPNAESDIDKTELETSKQTPISVAKHERVYALPKLGHVWVSISDEDKDDAEENQTAMATIVHNNKFDSTPSTPTAAAMLSGGSIVTMGTRKEIMEGVVWRCLRGEEPILPTSAGMGEMLTRNLKTGERKTLELKRNHPNGAQT